MSNVTALPGVTIKNEANPDVIEELEELLESARNGEVLGFAYSTVHSDGETFATGWAANMGARNVMGASIAALNHRFFSHLVGNGE